MAFLGGLLGGNYNKPGPGVNKDEPPKSAPVRFFEILWRKLSKIIQLNLIFLIPTVVVVVLMTVLFLVPYRLTLSLPIGGIEFEIKFWELYVVPLPIIFLSPFIAGLTIVTRNFVREEHAFVLSDFFDSVKSNFKLFFLNGIICYIAYTVISFSLIYYYASALTNSIFYVPLYLCLLIAVIFIFAQFYLPILMITFDLKLRYMYKNALIFAFLGLARNLLITAYIALLLFLYIYIALSLPIAFLIMAVFTIVILFSFTSYFISFATYPLIDKFIIRQVDKKDEAEDTSQIDEDIVYLDDEEF